MWHGDKKYKSHEREAHAFRGVVCQLALPQRLLPLQAREEEAGRQNGEIGARAPGPDFVIAYPKSLRQRV